MFDINYHFVLQVVMSRIKFDKIFKLIDVQRFKQRSERVVLR